MSDLERAFTNRESWIMVNPTPYTDSKVWEACYSRFPQCVGRGKTRDDAEKTLREMFPIWIEMYVRVLARLGRVELISVALEKGGGERERKPDSAEHARNPVDRLTVNHGGPRT